MTHISDDMVELPRPLCTYADHSYPAFSKAQMIAYGQACATAALEGSVAVPAETSDDAIQLRLTHHALVSLYKLCRDLGDFKNGVAHNGIDEGEVYASGIFDQVEAVLRGDWKASAIARKDRLPTTKVGE